MRETHRHDVLWALVVEHRYQPRLRRVERQVVPALLHRIQDVLEKGAAYIEGLSPIHGRVGDGVRENSGRGGVARSGMLHPEDSEEDGEGGEAHA